MLDRPAIVPGGGRAAHGTRRLSEDFFVGFVVEADKQGLSYS